MLERALQLMADEHPAFELHVAGANFYRCQRRLASLQRDPRVRYHGVLSRTQLAGLLASAPIFVFPSLAEGSARVVFEALASGCYVITTPNSGSIVEDGVHGRIIPPGDPATLADAIREALALGPEALSKIGASNARIVRERYRETQYGDNLVALYSSCCPPVSRVYNPRAAASQWTCIVRKMVAGPSEASSGRTRAGIANEFELWIAHVGIRIRNTTRTKLDVEGSTPGRTLVCRASP